MEYSDLGYNFIGVELFDFCEKKGILIKYALVAHPRANGQIKRDNGMILDALRMKIFDKNEKMAGKWIKEIPYIPVEHLKGIHHSSWSMAQRQCYSQI